MKPVEPVRRMFLIIHGMSRNGAGSLSQRANTSSQTPGRLEMVIHHREVWVRNSSITFFLMLAQAFPEYAASSHVLVDEQDAGSVLARTVK